MSRARTRRWDVPPRSKARALTRAEKKGIRDRGLARTRSVMWSIFTSLSSWWMRVSCSSADGMAVRDIDAVRGLAKKRGLAPALGSGQRGTQYPGGSQAIFTTNLRTYACAVFVGRREAPRSALGFRCVFHRMFMSHRSTDAHPHEVIEPRVTSRRCWERSFEPLCRLRAPSR